MQHVHGGDPSEIKAAVPKGKQRGGANAEKLGWLAFVSQLLRAHRARGRRDCRADADRSTLLEAKVPLEHQCFTNRRRPDLRWRNAQLAIWRRGSGPGDDEQEELARLTAQWAGFSDAERMAALAAVEAREVAAAAAASSADAAVPPKRRRRTRKKTKEAG